MNFNEYMESVKRTMNPLTHDQALQNWALGLVGESNELAMHKLGIKQDEGIIGELGDILYYTFAEIHQMGRGRFTYTEERRIMAANIKGDLQPYQVICIHAGQIAEVVKKHIYHNKPMIKFIQLDILIGIIVAVNAEAKSNGMTLHEVMIHNRDKLTTRHPEGFNANHAPAPF